MSGGLLNAILRGVVVVDVIVETERVRFLATRLNLGVLPFTLEWRVGPRWRSLLALLEHPNQRRST